jgi:phosphatidylserine decarboxylase
VYRAFARAVGANLDEVELDLAHYDSLGDFFARKLRHGARVIDAAPGAVISPCDGVIAARGRAVAGELLQAKGRTYQLAELIADAALAARLTGGAYATIYLSPRDYHRVHTPIAATVLGYDYLPGSLWSVKPSVVARYDVIARNERVVFQLDAGRLGRAALVMVGAGGVGNIRLAPALGGEVDSAWWRSAREPRRVELPGVKLAKGDELGAFRLGSTVVIVFEAGKIDLAGEIGDAVQFGQRFGTVVPGAAGGPS